ncbi:MAG: metallophosphoesterase, partial [Deltaproteobacteria bacterium]|nr:metallophosphoesterase [Deltaproteobacteria bacterium]
MPRLFQLLPGGPLDIIGDVHGEAEALLRLLARLGVDVGRRRAARPLVFVGDLVDRGPDSVTVVEVVSRLQEAGLAHCVAGNHELNALAGESKEG